MLTQKTVPELSRQVVVLTDGQVSNTDAVLEVAKAHAKTARVFTIGIGAGASHHLVQGLARAGGGSAESIFPGERIEPKVVRLFGRLLAPSLTDVSLNWGTLDVVSAPSTVPPLFTNSRLVMYGFVKTLAPSTLTLTGIGPNGKVSFDVALDPSQIVDGQTIGTLAARARIRELEESPEWTGARASRQGRTRTSAVTREIIDLAVRYNLVSRETSLVAIEKRDTPVKGDMTAASGPDRADDGMGRASRAACRGPRCLDERLVSLARASSMPIRMMRCVCVLRIYGSRVRWPKCPVVRRPRRDAGRSSAACGGSRSDLTIRCVAGCCTWCRCSAPTGRGSCQTSWRTSSAGRSRTCCGTLMDFGEDSPESRDAWATAMALAWLDRYGNDMRDEWELIARKGHQWLDRFQRGRDTYRTAASRPSRSAPHSLVTGAPPGRRGEMRRCLESIVLVVTLIALLGGVRRISNSYIVLPLRRGRGVCHRRHHFGCSWRKRRVSRYRASADLQTNDSDRFVFRRRNSTLTF